MSHNVMSPWVDYCLLKVIGVSFGEVLLAEMSFGETLFAEMSIGEALYVEMLLGEMSFFKCLLVKCPSVKHHLVRRCLGKYP